MEIEIIDRKTLCRISDEGWGGGLYLDGREKQIFIDSIKKFERLHSLEENKGKVIKKTDQIKAHFTNYN